MQCGHDYLKVNFDNFGTHKIIFTGIVDYWMLVLYCYSMYQVIFLHDFEAIRALANILKHTHV